MDVETLAFEWSYDGLGEPLSVHVVDGDGATVLVGGGDEPIADDLTAAARERGVDVVVAEHGHIDHYGAIPTLVEELDVSVAVPARDAHVLRAAGIAVDHELRGGESHWGLDVIATPGHTPGNAAFLADGVLLAGDTVAGSDSPFAAQREWSGPLALFRERFTADQAAAAESVGQLREYAIESIRLSHGTGVDADAGAAIETLCLDLGV